MISALFLLINIVDHTLMRCMDLSYLNLVSHIYNQFDLKLDHCIIQLEFSLAC